MSYEQIGIALSHSIQTQYPGTEYDVTTEQDRYYLSHHIQAKSKGQDIVMWDM